MTAKLELWTMPKCSGCEMVKRVLEAENIPFEEHHLDALSYRDQGDILSACRMFDPGMVALEAPIARNPATGDAIPASVLCDGRDIVAEVTRIL